MRRRTFLTWAIGAVVAAGVAAVAAVTAIFMTPPAGILAPAIRLPKRLADLADGEVIPILSPSGWSFVMADGGGHNRSGDIANEAFIVRTCGRTEVLAAICSHLGCTLVHRSERFECPCHGSTYETACAVNERSKFAVNGTVVHGPATFPLAHIRWGATSTPDEISVAMVRSRATGSA